MIQNRRGPLRGVAVLPAIFSFLKKNHFSHHLDNGTRRKKSNASRTILKIQEKVDNCGGNRTINGKEKVGKERERGERMLGVGVESE